MQMQTFVPQTLTVAISPNATPQTVPIPQVSGVAPSCIRIRNNTTQDVFIAFGASNVVPTVPTVGTNANGIPIPAGAVETISVPNNATTLGYIQAVAGSGNLYFTGGEGV